MTLSVEQLIAESRDLRLQKLPVYARELIHQMAVRLESEYIYGKELVKRAEQAANEAVALLGKGPEDSDTFLDLPRSVTRYSDDEEGQRPLGQGVNIEFRSPGEESGEGINVKMEDGRLKIHGLNALVVVPQDHTTVHIETR
jgi:hypothetical protein